MKLSEYHKIQFALMIFILKCLNNFPDPRMSHFYSLPMIFRQPKLVRKAITKTRLFKYIENFTTNKSKLSGEKFW